MVSEPDHQKVTGSREKKLVAFSSVMAAVFLTATKLIIGLLTGSLGILAEAAHSGLDLVAAGITYISVHISDRPADESHAYGHGKVENLSALIETLLLFITCAWIIYEAVQRLFFRAHPVEVTIWSFGVMAVSIVIDITRSRALMRTAKKYNSQALEADALHFSTDVWSSAVVILGLVGIIASQRLGASFGWLKNADAVAALGVSAIVLLVSYRLGSRTINVLLDTTPKGVTKQITDLVSKVPGVSTVQRIRVRQGGPVTFVDMTLEVSRSKKFEEADAIATEAETAVRNLISRCDVIVHVEPAGGENKSLIERVRIVAARQGLDVHNVFTYDVSGRLNLEVHAEVPEDLTLSAAHQRVTVFEEALHKEFPELVEAIVHAEPVGNASRQPSNLSLLSEMRHEIGKIVRQVEGVQDCHSITVLRERNHLVTSFHCTMASKVPVTQAHDLSEQIETRLRKRLPDLERVTIHLEPCDETCQTCDTACDYKRETG